MKNTNCWESMKTCVTFASSLAHFACFHISNYCAVDFACSLNETQGCLKLHISAGAICEYCVVPEYWLTCSLSSIRMVVLVPLLPRIVRSDDILLGFDIVWDRKLTPTFQRRNMLPLLSG
jgi:hypothetical protein